MSIKLSTYCKSSNNFNLKNGFGCYNKTGCKARISAHVHIETKRDYSVSMKVVKEYKQRFYLQPKTSESGIKKKQDELYKKGGSIASSIYLTRLQRQQMGSLSRSMTTRRRWKSLFASHSLKQLCSTKHEV